MVTYCHRLREMMKYKGYTAHIEFDNNLLRLHGTVLLTKGVIDFKGYSVDEIEEAFHDSIDSYLEFCKDQNTSPENPREDN